MSKGNLGRMGETFFNNLCASVNLNCNESNEDNTGWDFLVEFPHEYNIAPLADKSPPVKELKIQVKSTNKNTGKLQIKLSNLMRLSTTPIPSFFVFIEYNDSTPESLYLVHVGRDIIFSTLKRARTISMSDARKDFNKYTLSISYNESNKIGELNGQALLDAINKHIPYGMAHYLKNKNDMLMNLGYEKSRIVMRFNTNGICSNEDILSASLGWVDQVKISDVLGFDSRFEILSKCEELSSSEAFLSFETKATTLPGKITFENLTTRVKLRFNCEIMFPPILHALPNDLWKLRVKSETFDFLISSHGKSSYRLIKSDKKVGIFDLRDILTLMRWFLTNEEQIEIKLTSIEHGNSGSFTSSKITQISSITNNQLNRLDKTITSIIELANKLNIQSQINISLNDLNIASNSLVTLQALCKEGGIHYPSMNLKLESKKTDIALEREKICIIIVSCKLGDIKIYGILSFKGKINTISEGYSMPNPLVIVENLIESFPGDNLNSQFKNIVDEISLRYMSEDADLIVFPEPL